MDMNTILRLAELCRAGAESVEVKAVVRGDTLNLQTPVLYRNGIAVLCAGWESLPHRGTRVLSPVPLALSPTWPCSGCQEARDPEGVSEPPGAKVLQHLMGRDRPKSLW